MNLDHINALIELIQNKIDEVSGFENLNQEEKEVLYILCDEKELRSK